MQSVMKDDPVVLPSPIGRYGHPWHSMCSYLGAFPPALARTLIALFSAEGDVVLDPFSGRGTTLLEARLLNRLPLASDLNPIALALSRSKNVRITRQALDDRISELEGRFDPALYAPQAAVQPEPLQWVYNATTLAELVYLKRRLVASGEPEDIVLTGAVLGIMHGKGRVDGTSAYLSVDMPNTYSMSPEYVRRYVAKKLNRPYRPVFDTLRQKVDRLFRAADAPSGITGPVGHVREVDVRNIGSDAGFADYTGKVQLVVTSPPYLGVVNYAKQNWIRGWLLEEAYRPVNDTQLDDQLSIDRWLDFAMMSLREVRKLLRPGGTIVYVVGDVATASGTTVSLGREILRRVYHDGLFASIGVADSPVPDRAKTTRIWGDTRGRATQVDRVLIFSDGDLQLEGDRLTRQGIWANGFEFDARFPTADEIQANALRLAGLER